MAHAWERWEILVQRPDRAMQEFLLETGDSCIGGPRMLRGPSCFRGMTPRCWFVISIFSDCLVTRLLVPLRVNPRSLYFDFFFFCEVDGLMFSQICELFSQTGSSYMVSNPSSGICILEMRYM